MDAANALISAPFDFYGGYLQMSTYGKDNFLKEPAARKLAWYVKQLVYDRQLTMEDKVAIEQVATVNFELAQKDADRIAKLSKELNNASKDLKMELNRQKEQKRLLYEEVSTRLNDVKNEYHRFRRFVEAELTLKDAIIDKQNGII
jgi:hypothetical protein